MSDLNKQADWRLKAVVAVFAVLLLAAGIELCLPVMMTPRSHEMPSCRLNLRMIGKAINRYATTHEGLFPPAATFDSERHPMHSWRILIAPYLRDEWQEVADGLRNHTQQSGFWKSRDLQIRAHEAQKKADQLKAVISAYGFSEPWDSQNNRKLADLPVDAYLCPGGSASKAGFTHFAVVVGDETAWPGKEPFRFGGFMDGSSKTAIIVQITNSDIPWTEPRDLRFSDSAFQINTRGVTNCIGDPSGDGAWAFFADGTSRYLSNSTSPNTLKALFTVAGGDEVGEF